MMAVEGGVSAFDIECVGEFSDFMELNRSIATLLCEAIIILMTV